MYGFFGYEIPDNQVKLPFVRKVQTQHGSYADNEITR